jgi:hypothetical protein
VIFRLLILFVTGLLARPILLSAETSAGPADEIKIIRTFIGWREAASFKHISEYFDRQENTHGEVMMRSQPDQRGGYYFLLRLTNAGAPATVHCRIQLIMPSGPPTTEFTFTPELKSGATVLNLGLTGRDWPGPKINPVAWKLTLTASDGRVLATDKSYLWEKPPSP